MRVATETMSVLLGPDGPMGDHLPGFNPRDQQREMATLIADCLQHRDTALCEAGTGTGKTLAYLVPALSAELKTIVSTATKTLQDQLFFRDIPAVKTAIGSNATVSLLKGRANYLCLHRLELQQGSRDLFGHGMRDIAAISDWSHLTNSGDVSTCQAVSDSSPLWQRVTSTVDNCLGQACEHFDDCFVVKARREAISSDVVVVNHHLLFADIALKEGGFGELLPAAEAVVIDEAHQVPATAAMFFGYTVSSHQLQELARDSLAAQAEEAGEDLQLRAALECIDVASNELRHALGDFESRSDLQRIRNNPTVVERFEELTHIIEMVEQQLDAASSRGPALESCFERLTRLKQQLQLFMPGLQNQGGEPGAVDERLLSNDEGEVSQGGVNGSDNFVQWLEKTNRGYVLHATPISIAKQFQALIEGYTASWIFTSATLSVGGDFNYFQSQLGLQDARIGYWESPFDYAKQAMLYLPEFDVDPRDDSFTAEVAGLAKSLIEASKGRTFILCTSFRALREIADSLRGAIDYPLLVQGEQPRSQLLEEFQRLGNAVLVATSTFWQGVDVRGSALSLVLIDKLPFASPSDPVTRARIRLFEESGGNGFMDYQVPEAVIALKQGAGRLIRDEYDNGVLVICDPRIKTKSYGKTFLKALPDMARSRSLDDAVTRLKDI